MTLNELSNASGLIYMNFTTSSSSFITRFPWQFKINFRQMLLEDFFCSTQKIYLWYFCKMCLKELEILLKCKETFEKFIAACNSSKNAGLPQFFFKVFWQLYFKNISFLTKTKRCLLFWLYPHILLLCPIIPWNLY